MAEQSTWSRVLHRKVSVLLQVVKGQQGAICTADLVRRESTGSYFIMIYNILQTLEEMFC